MFATSRSGRPRDAAAPVAAEIKPIFHVAPTFGAAVGGTAVGLGASVGFGSAVGGTAVGCGTAVGGGGAAVGGAAVGTGVGAGAHAMTAARIKRLAATI